MDREGCMRRVYLVYQLDRSQQIDIAAGAATALLDTADLSYQAAGRGKSPRRYYDAFLRMQESGDAALEDKLTWDDEVWVAVDIGSIAAGDIFNRVCALNPIPSVPASIDSPVVAPD